VLEWVMDPKTGGLHPKLFGPSLVGIAFINIVEVGFIFSGNVGTGIVLARKPDGTWSPPTAIGLTGIGWGFIMGASLKDIVYLIYDEMTLKAMSGDVGVKLSTQTEAALGTWGRTAEATNIISNKGIGCNIALSYSKGIFGGLSVEGAVCNPRKAVNQKFYGKKVSPKEILFDGAVEVPDGTLMPEVYTKLERLCSGSGIYEPTEEYFAKVESIRVAADKEGEEAVKEEEVTYVVMEDEIRKEAES
jgi:lipid-binding SYLF domain-containing protein